MLGPVDLSHLTPEEQKQILSVLRRQQDEEEKEHKIYKVLQEQLEDFKSQVQSNVEEVQTDADGTADSDPVCVICMKTKFAGGSGHVCSLCQNRFCTRCGGKITVRSNKTIWICNLCRKEREILLKSGAWFHGNGSVRWDAKSLSGSEKENVSNNINNHAEKDSRSNNSSREASEKSESTVLPFKMVREEANQSSDGTSQKSSPTRISSLAITKSPYPKSDSEHSRHSEKRNSVSPHSCGFYNDHSPNRSIELGRRPSKDQRIPTVYQETIDLPRRKESYTSEVHTRVSDVPRSHSEIPSATSYYKPQMKPTSAIISHTANPHLDDRNRTGSITSFDDEIQSTTDYSSFGDYISDSDFPLSRRSALHEQSNLRHNRRRREGRSSISAVNNEDYSPLCNRLPAFWQPSSDGMFLIGHLTLHKNTSMLQGSKSLLGFKVVGGKTTATGRLGAFITRVRRGSLADTVGHLKPGDEIISWNKLCLQDATFSEVYRIIAESNSDPAVELVVSRPIRDTPRIPETRLLQTAESSTCSLDSDRRDSDMSSVKHSSGKIQIKIWYNESVKQLHITAMRAVDLPAREGGLHRNPYLKMYLLPDRSSASKRKTKIAKKSLAPEWMQSFVYGEVRTEDLGAMALELTVWDLDRSLNDTNRFIGEVIIDLGLVCLDDEPHWFRLMPIGRGMDQDYHAVSNHTTSSAHLASCGALDISAPSVQDNSTVHSPKSITKRRLPSLPKNFNQNADEDTTDLSSLVETELDIGDSASQNLSHSQYGNDYDQYDSTSMHQTVQTFVGGTGPGQIVGMQALTMSPVGEIELGFKCDQKRFVVQIIQGLNLPCRPSSRSLPAFIVKVYMMDGMKRIAKKKTKLSSKSLSPVFKEALIFEPNPVCSVIQVMVWAVYGRIDGKLFTGVVDISLEELDLSTMSRGRYKLFASSMLDSKHWSKHDSNSSFGSSSVLQS